MLPVAVFHLLYMASWCLRAMHSDPHRQGPSLLGTRWGADGGPGPHQFRLQPTAKFGTYESMPTPWLRSGRPPGAQFCAITRKCSLDLCHARLECCHCKPSHTPMSACVHVSLTVQAQTARCPSKVKNTSPKTGHCRSRPDQDSVQMEDAAGPRAS